MIEDVQRANSNVRLEINHTKTMAIINGYKKQIKVNGNPLEYTYKYIYLGNTTNLKKKTTNWRSREEYSEHGTNTGVCTICKSNMPIDLKTRTINSRLLPN